MARMRTVKPGLRTSRVVGQWPFEVRYFWVLLWGYLDDKGRGHDIPKAIAGDCFPLDEKVTAAVVGRWLDLIARTKLAPDHEPPLCRYEVAGTRYLHAVNWGEHQRPSRPSPSRIPQCPVHEGLTESLTESVRESPPEPFSESPSSPQVLVLEGLRGREFEGLRAAAEPVTEPAAPTPAGEPPPKCPKHIEDPDPPSCGACADARRRHEAWTAEQDRAAEERRQAVTQALAKARRGPACEHGEPGGASPHPSTGKPLCALCRAAARAAITKGTP